MSTSAPRFAALQLFTRVLRGAAKRASAKEADLLVTQTLSLLEAAKDDRIAQTTALGVATSLLQDRDVTPIINQLDPKTLSDGNLLALWIKLATWSAVASQNLELLEKAKGALADWLGQSVSADLEHSQLILLLAESDAALHASDARKWKALSQLGSQLAKLAASELGAEARLVEAIGLAHSDRREAAIAVLAELLDSDTATNPVRIPSGLRPVAAGFRVGLQALSASSNRTALEADLKRLITEVHAETPPSVTTETWLELWRRSLRLPAAKCSLGACSAKVLARDLEQRVGPRAALLLKQGILPVGGAGLSLDYSFTLGLRPLVQLEPQLLAVGP